MRGLRIGLAVFAFLVYLAFPTKNYYWDGISFAQRIEDAARWPELLHPNHLIYNLLGWIVYRGLGVPVRALYVLQAMNAAWAALALYWLSGILAPIVRSPRAVLLLGAVFAFAGTWWRYATDAGAYIPSVALMIACAALLVPGRRPRPVLVALLHAAAMLIHQLALFLFPAALFALWHQDRQNRPRIVIAYAGLAGSLTLGTYAAGFTALFGYFSLPAFLAWMTSYADDATFSFSFLRNLGLSVRGWAQLFFIGRPSLLREPSVVDVVLLLICGAALVALLVSFRRMRVRFHVHQSGLFRFALAWIAAHVLFLFFWQPQNTFYKLFALPGFVLLIASSWEPGRDPHPRGAGTAFAALLALSNLTLGIIPYSRASSNDVVAFAQDLRLSPGSVVFFRAFNTDDWYARYFNPQSQWRAAGSTMTIDDELRAGHAVWLETTAADYYATSDPSWFADRTRSTERRELIKPGRRLRFVQLAAR